MHLVHGEVMRMGAWRVGICLLFAVTGCGRGLGGLGDDETPAAVAGGESAKGAPTTEVIAEVPSAEKVAAPTPAASAPKRLKFTGACSWGSPGATPSCKHGAGRAVATFWADDAPSPATKVFVHNSIATAPGDMCVEPAVEPPASELHLMNLGIRAALEKVLEWDDSKGRSSVSLRLTSSDELQFAIDSNNALDRSANANAPEGVPCFTR
jgi:hypothetical protein